ncbi:MAG: EamA family transporter [Lentimicrobiaceae bacterium]|nr:EamA family transporter [Lentimicrobiaceae bacterium]
MARKEVPLAWFILFSLMLIWGSSFILIKKALLYFDAIEVGGLRMVMAWLLLLPYAIKRIRRFDRSTWLFLAISGFIGSTIPSFLFPLAQRGIDSSLAGMLNSLTPLFTMLLGLAFFRRPAGIMQIAGVFIGLTGAVGLISVSGEASFRFNVGYAAYIILATLFYAVNANVIKSKLMHLNPVTITSLAFFLVGPPVLTGLLTCTPFLDHVSSRPDIWQGILIVAILGMVGTGLSLMAYNKLIHMTTPLFASSVTYLMPVVAVLWGIVDGEVFRIQYIFWIILILLGVALSNIHNPIALLRGFLAKRRLTENP